MAIFPYRRLIAVPLLVFAPPLLSACDNAGRDGVLAGSVIAANAPVARLIARGGPLPPARSRTGYADAAQELHGIEPVSAIAARQSHRPMVVTATGAPIGHSNPNVGNPESGRAEIETADILPYVERD